MSYGSSELEAQRAAYNGLRNYLHDNYSPAFNALQDMSRDDVENKTDKCKQMIRAMLDAYHNSLQAAASPY